MNAPVLLVCTVARAQTALADSAVTVLSGGWELVVKQVHSNYYIFRYFK